MLRRALQRVLPFYQHRYNDLHRWHIDSFAARFARSVPAGALVLDAGAGEGRHRPLFEHARYIACDLGVGDSTWDYSSLDVLANLLELPFRRDCFDAVHCSEVLEHTNEPQAVIEEYFRVLRSGGRLCITVPMLLAEHQTPYDWWRPTRFGLRYRLEKAGFRIETFETFGGYWSNLMHHFRMAFQWMPQLLLKVLRHPLVWLAELKDAGRGDEGYVVGFFVIASKP